MLGVGLGSGVPVLSVAGSPSRDLFAAARAQQVSRCARTLAAVQTLQLQHTHSYCTFCASMHRVVQQSSQQPQLNCLLDQNVWQQTSCTLSILPEVSVVIVMMSCSEVLCVLF